MKPLEFKIIKDTENENEVIYKMIFYYENGKTEDIYFHAYLPDGLELDKHYSIGDLYGYKVIDDRKGL